MTQSETTSAAGGPLWCMHIQGPDDLHAAPDFWTALAWAAELNSFIAEKAAKGNWKADDNYPLSQAVVRQWTGTPESHAVQCEIELADRAEHEAKRKAAALAAPTAKGGTECQCEHPFIKCDNTGCRCSYCGLLERLPPPPAGAAGGGLGDLGALMTTDPAPNAAASHATNFRTLSVGAPTPDLGAQGEPVAWQGCDPDEPYDPLKCAIWAALVPFQQELLRTGGVTFMGLRNAIVEAVRSFAIASQRDALAPAAPRTGSGVSVEEIEPFSFKQPQRSRMHDVLRRLGAAAIRSQKITDHEAATAAQSECLREIEALVTQAQAPRDGGETQGGWRLVPTNSHQLGHEPVAAFHRAFEAHYKHHGLFESFSVGWKALLAAAPTPPSGVETIRQAEQRAILAETRAQAAEARVLALEAALRPF